MKRAAATSLAIVLSACGTSAQPNLGASHAGIMDPQRQQGPSSQDNVVAIISGLLEDGICSGTLISDRVVLTAAHCVCDGQGNVRSPSEYKVSRAINVFSYPDSLEVAELKPFDGYSPWVPNQEDRHDIALIRLKDRVGTPKSGFAFLNIADVEAFVDPSLSFLVYGYGAYDQYDQYNPDGTITKATKLDGQRRVGQVELLKTLGDNELMVSGGTSCHGDSGGPLFYSEDGTSTSSGIFGVVSRPVRIDDCHNQPVIFTRVDSYNAFISDYVKAASVASDGSDEDAVAYAPPSDSGTADSNDPPDVAAACNDDGVCDPGESFDTCGDCSDAT